MKKSLAIVIVLVFVLLRVEAPAQSIKGGIYFLNSTTLSVRAQSFANWGSHPFSALAFTLRWNKDTVRTLGTPLGSFGVSPGTTGSDPTYNYQVYGATPGLASFTWNAGVEVELCQIPVTGAGTIYLAPYPSVEGINGVWYVELGSNIQIYDSSGTGLTEFYADRANSFEPLPIQLSSFTAAVVNQNGVRLDWTTATETNNYGFEVQKSAGNQNSYQTISNSFIAGHGTTIEPHSYAFVDNTASPGQWYYRLRQIDMDGTDHFSEGIQVDVLTGVTEKPLPKVFALDQNYPNPFNPSTKIEYAVPKESHVLLEVYNIIGQKVATLVDEAKSAGYYSATFDASRFASGLYFYSMKAGNASFLKKMMLVK